METPKTFLEGETLAGHPLSPQQERLWAIPPPGGALFEARCRLLLRGELDREVLRESLCSLMAEHEILRTRFEPSSEAADVMQVVGRGDLAWRFVDGRFWSPERRESELARFFEATSRSRDGEGPLRALLVASASEEHVLLLRLTALCSDAASLDQLTRELAMAYDDLIRGEDRDGEPLQYVEVCEVLNEMLDSEEGAAGIEYWTEVARDQTSLDPEAPLPFAKPPASEPLLRRRSSNLSPGVTAAARSWLKATETEPELLMLLLWSILLGFLSGRSKVVMGVAFSGRGHQELKAVLGLFARHLPLAVPLRGEQKLVDSLSTLRETVGEHRQWQDCFSWQGYRHALPPGRSGLPYGFEYAPLPLTCCGGGVDFTVVDRDVVSDRFDLKLTCGFRDGRLRLDFTYDDGSFDPSAIRRLANGFEALLCDVLERPETSLAELSPLPRSDRHRLLCELNDTHRPLPARICLHQLVTDRAMRTPERTAVICDRQGSSDQLLSYGELDARSGRLARRLQELGVGAGTRVGICAERSLELVVGMLAILRAGGAYLPLDPSHPPQRLSFVMEDAGVRMVLIQDSVAGRLPIGDRLRVSLAAADIGEDGAEAPARDESTADRLAYLIYTSGSTGQPKGVMMSHGAIANRVLWMGATLGGDGERVVQKTAITFDASIWELFAPLIFGGQLVLAPPGAERDMSELLRVIARQRVTTLQLVPSMLPSLLAAPNLADGAGLRRLFCGGEALAGEWAARVRSRLGCRVVNLYGPTETAIDATSWPVEGEDGESATVPIGRPLDNVRVYLLDASLRPVVDGSPGELLVAGAGMARGYCNRPGLTADRWLPDPFASEPGGRLYRTGDEVVRRPSGALAFLGRLDQQVKLRGYRIELGEIEAALSEHPGLRQAAVTTSGETASGEARLVAWVIAEDRPPGGHELRRFLERSLPEHMIPALFVACGDLPRTTSGKLDRVALSQRELPAPEVGQRSSTAPQTLSEEILAGMWSDLLGLEQVGVDQDFFELGGHSLLITRLVSRLRKSFGVEIAVRELFEAPTVELQARLFEAARRSDKTPPPPLVPQTGEEPLPLSFAQQRLWLIDRLDPGDAAYNLPMVVGLSGPLEIPALAASHDEILRRHAALRTVFIERDGDPVQVIQPPAARPLPVIDLGRLPAPEREEQLRRLGREEAARPFDLSRNFLSRALLLRLANEEHVAFFTLHHIASDAWSMDVLRRELAILYRAACRGEPSPLPRLPVQYADFAVWQRRWLQGAMLEDLLSYWRETLADPPAALELPADHPRPAVWSSRGKSWRLSLPPTATDALRALARGEGATLYMALMALFQILLSRTTGQRDLLVGTPVACRNPLETEALIGFFVNTLVLRANLRSEPGFRELLGQTRDRVLAAVDHQDLPFERLVEELALPRDLSRNPLFQAMFAFFTASTEAPALEGVSFRPRSIENRSTHFDLTLELTELPDEVSGLMTYSRDLFEEVTIGRLAAHFGNLLAEVTRDPEAPVSALPLLDAAERHQLVCGWNDAEADVGEALPLHRRFELQAQRVPERVAVVFEASSGEPRLLSYEHLDRAANCLAHHLIDLGLRPEDRVGLLMERSLEMMIALWAVLKAGAAYVPLDPSYPDERLAFMVNDFRHRTGTTIVVAQPALAEHWKRIAAPLGSAAKDIRRVYIDRTITRAERHSAPPKVATSPEQAAYMIYTSGSTGQPKGTINSHRGIVNRLFWMDWAFELRAEDRILQKTPLSFDVSVWELFWPLISGACLVVARPGGHRAPIYLVQQIQKARVTTLHFVPSMLQIFVEQNDLETLTSLRRVIASGEALSADLVTRFDAAFASTAELHNLYGPTEAAIDVTWWPCRVDGVTTQDRRVPIGRPIFNTRTYVLDQRLRPVPISVAGELHLGGVQLARGYQGRAGLTARSFISDPFSFHPGERLYKTGDLTCWRRDGVVEFLGRTDSQVKLRGFRVELPEIEVVLSRHPGVNEVVVTVVDYGGDLRLVAYLVPAERGSLEDRERWAAGLKEHLAEKLPEYMVPSAFIALAAMPLTANGKIDRRALPAPVWASSSQVAPRSTLEAQLAAMFCDVLGLDSVGIHDNFFELGGHSLLATRLTSRLRRSFGVEIPLLRLFQAPTVAMVAQLVEEALNGPRTTAPAITPLPRSGEWPDGGLPLSFAQERLWFLHRWNPKDTQYNLFRALRLEGVLHPPLLEAVLGEILRRHEGLRSTFEDRDGRAHLIISPPARPALPILDLGHLPAGDREAELARRLRGEAQRAFDLSRGPLLRAILLRLEERRWVLSVAVHHIVTDGWSMAILVREVGALYRILSEGGVVPGRPPLPDLPIQYADFASWQRQWLRGEVLERQLGYWRRQLDGAPRLLELPTDRPRAAVQTHRGACRLMHLPGAAADALETLARRHGATLFMALLGLFAHLLSRYAGQRELCLGSPIANRNRAETEDLIGLFVNTLVLRVDLAGEPSLEELLVRVREVTLGAYDHQDLPFERLVDELAPERELAHSPLFQVLFALQNLELETLELPGLTLSELEAETETAKFDLLLAMVEGGGELRGELEFNADLFDATTAERLLTHLRLVIEGAVADSVRPLATLSTLPAAERQQLLGEWNDTDTVYETALLHDLVKARAAAVPESVAVAFEDRWLSYRELENLADRLAGHLSALAVGAESVVGVMMERSVELVVALLGILKAGAAYLPVDPSYPEERLAFMLEDAGLEVILTQSRLRSRLPAGGARVLCLDAGWRAAGEHSEPARPASDHAAAYVIYTSGSTGRPKGVVVPHRGICNRILWMQEEYRLTAADRVLQKTPYSFDVSVWEFFWPLLTGAALVMARPDGHRDQRYLAEVIARQRITTLHFVPSMLSAFLEQDGLRSLSSLRRVIASGEALPADLVARCFDRLPAELHNLYGPTEASIDVTYHACRRDAESSAVPIGRPVANTSIHLLDDRLAPVPIGVAGELYIGGIELARGYLARPRLTAERFVPNPFARQGGERLYRTGDLARSLAQGPTVFLGRQDHQVKVRGFRIELGEIETAMLNHPALREVVVLARHDEKRPGQSALLVAYFVVGEGSTAPGVEELQGFLRRTLPDYMVPSAFVGLEALPWTPSGKVDRRALPAPDSSRPDLAQRYVPPTRPEEEVLAAIWSEVLNVDRVGIHDSFFALGGDSILSLRVLALARDRGMEFSLPELFQNPTIAQLARLPRESSAAGPATQSMSLVADDDRRKLAPEVEDAYPLSALQQGMFYFADLMPEHPVFHNIDSWKLRCRFEPALFEQAVQWVVARHPVLRTSFDFETFSEPLQLVHRQVPTPLSFEDLRPLSAAEQDAEVQRFIERQTALRFEPSVAPLIRLAVHRLGEDTLQLTVIEHHAINDGWSLHSSLAEIFERYFDLVAGRPLPPPEPLAVTFRDFIHLERQAARSESARAYWSEILNDCRVLELPPRPDPPPGPGEPRMLSLDTEIPLDLCEAVQRLARDLRLPAKSLLLAVHLKSLSLLGSETDVLSGLVTNGRPEGHDGENIRGLFLNTLPFRLRVTPDTSWLKLSQAVFTAEQELLPHRRFPLVELQRALGQRDLFSTAFNYVHFHVTQGLLETGDVELLTGGGRVEETNFTLAVTLYRSPVSSQVWLQLRGDLTRFSAPQVAGAAELYLRTLRAMVENPQANHDTAALLSPVQRHQLLHEWGPAPEKSTGGRLLHELFEDRARQSPAAIALMSANGQWSYGELARRVERRARDLRRRGVRRGRVVALCCERSPEMIVAQLAVLAAGGAWVFLDPSHPPTRRRHLLQATGASLVLTQARLAAAVRDEASEIVCLDLDDERAVPATKADRARRAIPEDVIYIAYTSGSTGQPKGILSTHRGVANFLGYLGRYLRAGETVLQLTSQVFDASLRDTLAPLAYGARIVLPTEDQASSPPALLSLIRQHRISRIPSVVPTVLRELVAVAEDEPPGRSLRTILVSGEMFYRSDVARVRAAFGDDVTVVDQYGPTECTMISTHHRLPCWIGEAGGAGTGGQGHDGVGRPIPGAEVYVLDRFHQPCPAGVVGEVLLGGAGLAHGYLHEPVKTAAAFLPHPWPRRPGARLYATGDLARQRLDGNLELRGRRDQQIKLRGLRVEPGEIESALLSHSQVQAAVVVSRQDAAGDRMRLGAYFVPVAAAPATARLREFLATRLPAALVPAFLIALDELPRTASGKVDRAALPAPDAGEAADAVGRAAPRTPLEELLSGLWGEILGRVPIGIDEDFFALGGDSLLAIRMMARMRHAIGVELPLRLLFEAPTIARLAARFETARRTLDGPEVPPLTAAGDGPFPLSFAQQQLWLAEQMTPGNSAYNLTQAVRIRGRLRVPVLALALCQTVERHSALRTAFRVVDGAPWQVVLPIVEVPLPEVDLSSLGPTDAERRVEKLATELVRIPFDLVRGTLVRTTLLRLADDEHVLVLAIHHLVADAWSIGIFFRDVAARYHALAAGGPSPLPELSFSYGDYSVWQRRWLRGEALERQLDSWRRRMADAPPLLELPTDRPRPAAQRFRGARARHTLPRALSDELRALCRRQGCTMFMLLAAAFDVVLHWLTGRDDLVLGTDVANRGHGGLEDLVGFFINQLPLRVDLGGDPSFEGVLARVREAALDLYANHDLPFEKLVEALQPERTPSYAPVVQVKIVYHNWPVQSVSSGELELEPMAIHRGTSQLDLNLGWIDSEQGLVASAEYDTDLFDAESVRRTLHAIQTVLEEVVQQPTLPLAELGNRLTQIVQAKHSARENELQKQRSRRLGSLKRGSRRRTGLKLGASSE